MLSDNGNEFKGDFTKTVDALNVRHTRIHAGRPQTNGHVEALHKTILDECWRPAFARYLYPRYTGLKRELDTLPALLQHRPHTPRQTHTRTHPRRHRLPCPKDGGKMSRTCRHISEAAHAKARDCPRNRVHSNRRRLQTLEDEQDKLLELHYKGGVAENVMRRQTQRIETEERTLQQLLSRSEIELAEIREALDEALKLTETPLETYLAASDLGRRLLNQAFFSEIRVGADGEVKQATLEKAYVRIIAPRLIRHRPQDPTWPRRPQRRPNSDPFSLGPEFDRDKIGAPGEIRTPDLRFRRPTLYPAELRAQSVVVYRRPAACPETAATGGYVHSLSALTAAAAASPRARVRRRARRRAVASRGSRRARARRSRTRARRGPRRGRSSPDARARRASRGRRR
jgi:hypothetical protein